MPTPYGSVVSRSPTISRLSSWMIIPVRITSSVDTASTASFWSSSKHSE
jgi:hypothetical protein